MRPFFALLFAVTLSSCSSCRRSDTLFVDPALLALVPPDSVYLAGVKLEKIRETPIYKKYAQNETLKGGLDAFEQQTGIDARKDLWEVVYSSNGAGKSIVLGRGSFAGMGLEPSINKPGIERSSYKGYMLFTKGEGGVVFMNSSTIAAGRISYLHELIDARNSNPPAPKEFFEKIKAIKRNNQAWVVSRTGLPVQALLQGLGDESAASRNLMANLPRLLGNVNSSLATLDLAENFHLVIDGDCPTERDAKMLNEALRGGIGLARLQMTNNLEAQRLLDIPKVTVTKVGVSVDINYTSEDLTVLAELFSPKK